MAQKDVYGNYTPISDDSASPSSPASGGFAAGDNRSADYGGGEPTYTPASEPSWAIDTSNGRHWEYWGGAWH